MTLEEEIRKFIDSRKWVCSRMLQEDDGYLGALYVRAQRSLLKELEELLKNFTLQSRTATDGKERYCSNACKQKAYRERRREYDRQEMRLST